MSARNLSNFHVISDSSLLYPHNYEKSNLDYFMTNFQRLSFAIMEIVNTPSKDYTPVDQILQKRCLEMILSEKANDNKGLKDVLPMKRKCEDVLGDVLPVKRKIFGPIINLNYKSCRSEIKKEPLHFSLSGYFTEDCFAISGDSFKTFEIVDNETKGQDCFSVSEETDKTSLGYELVARLVFSTSFLSDYYANKRTKCDKPQKIYESNKSNRQERCEDYLRESGKCNDCGVNKSEEGEEIISFIDSIDEYSLHESRTKNDAGCILDDDVLSITSECDGISDSMNSESNSYNGDSRPASINESFFSLTYRDDRAAALTRNVCVLSNSYEKNLVSTFDFKPTKGFKELMKEYSLDYFSDLPVFTKEAEDYLVRAIRPIIANTSVNNLRKYLKNHEPVTCILRKDKIKESKFERRPEYCFYVDECSQIQEKNLKIFDEVECDIIEDDINNKLYLPKELLQ